ncbi:MAG: hypothetical protein IJ274_16980 [Lachnospiraceae bacterium]|nr:hypothetical protein [Lachnospiraceae bacterium]
MKKTRFFFTPIGSSSLVMILVMIYFITFASLSVLTAHSDYQLSKKMADDTFSYYTADAIARDVTKLVDEELFSIYQKTSDISDFFNELSVSDFSENAPDGAFDFTLEKTEEHGILSYTVHVSDTQTLQIALNLNYPLDENECFSTITRWQLVNEPQPEHTVE